MHFIPICCIDLTLLHMIRSHTLSHRFIHSFHSVRVIHFQWVKRRGNLVCSIYSYNTLKACFTVHVDQTYSYVPRLCSISLMCIRHHTALWRNNSILRRLIKIEFQFFFEAQRSVHRLFVSVRLMLFTHLVAFNVLCARILFSNHTSFEIVRIFSECWRRSNSLH